MKFKNKILSMTMLGLSINQAATAKNLNPTFGTNVPTNQFSFDFNHRRTKSIILSLRNILIQDNLERLKTFIKENPTFQWNEKYLNLPWKKESQTPLSAATWLGSINCVEYLLANNIGNIKASYDIVSSRGFSALHYAKNPPKPSKSYKNQKPENFEKIATLLDKNMPKKKRGNQQDKNLSSYRIKCKIN